MKVPSEKTYKHAYLPYKAVHFPYKLRQIKRGEIPVPCHIQVDLTGRCNYNCVHCFYRNAGFRHLEFVPNEEIPLKIGMRLFDEMADIGVPALELTGGGEPLMYPKIGECLDRISKRDLELAIVTNGSLFTKDILDRISGMKWTRFSIDAATPKTYKRIHRTPKKMFDITLSNLRRVIDRNFNDCMVGVSYVVNQYNVEEIHDAAKTFKEMGVGDIRYSFAYTSKYGNLLTAEQKKSALGQMDRASQDFADKRFKVFPMSTRLDDFAPIPKEFNFCGYQIFTFQIGCDSMAYPCCVVKYWKKYAFGNLKRQSLRNIIFGKGRRDYIEKFDVDKCLPCWIKHKNIFIEYLLTSKRNATTVNFI